MTTTMRLYKPGNAYMKAGVGLVELTDRRRHQFDMLHSGQSEKADRVMAILDRINRTQGKSSAFLASRGVLSPWYMRQQIKSPEYTTSWEEIPKIRL